MTATRALLLTGALLGCGLAAAAELTFDGEAYRSAGIERDAARVAENFLRQGESAERFSRRITVADHPKAASVKQLGIGVVAIAQLRAPGLKPGVYSAEGAEDRDLTVTYIALAEDGSAVEFHAIRFVALKDDRGVARGAREYHFTSREYLNGRHPDQALAVFAPVIAGFEERWVEALQALDRAPAGAR